MCAAFMPCLGGPGGAGWRTALSLSGSGRGGRGPAPSHYTPSLGSGPAHASPFVFGLLSKIQETILKTNHL